MKEVEPTRIKQMRIYILRYLHELCPTPLQVRTIYNSLVGFDENYNKELMAKDLWYLKKKGYIEYSDDLIGGADLPMDKVIKLTAEGKEIAERTNIDRMLEI